MSDLSALLAAQLDLLAALARDLAIERLGVGERDEGSVRVGPLGRDEGSEEVRDRVRGQRRRRRRRHAERGSRPGRFRA